MVNQLKELENETLAKVQSKVLNLAEEGELNFPPNFSPVNALKSSWLTITQKDMNGTPILDIVTKTSVTNALLDTVLWGLTPAREQVYFIPYKNKNTGDYELSAQPSYFGDLAIAKRVAPVKDAFVNLVFDEDDLVIEKGPNDQLVVAEHNTAFEHRDNDLRGGYCVVEFTDERPNQFEIMTMKEIRKSWDQSPMRKSNKGDSGTHEDFPGQMTKRTLMRRAVKTHTNTADDRYLNPSQAKEVKREMVVDAEAETKKDEESNQEMVDVSESPQVKEGEEGEEVDQLPEGQTEDESETTQTGQDESEEDEEDTEPDNPGY